MTRESSSIEAAAAKRFSKFQQRPDVKSVAVRYGDWSRTEIGRTVMLSLAFSALMRLQGQVTRTQYDDGLRVTAASTSIPLPDIRLMAESLYEAKRFYIVSRKLLPRVTGDWNCGGNL